MVRKSTDSRSNPLPNARPDVVSTNNTAAHFLRAAQPTWMYANPQAAPIQPRMPYNENTVPCQAQPGPPSRPEPTKTPTPHQHPSGTIQNADGLPSPAPSHESNRATPETSVARSTDNMYRSHAPPAVNNRQTSGSDLPPTGPDLFQVPTAPPTATIPSQSETPELARRPSRMTGYGYHIQNPPLYLPSEQYHSSSNNTTPVRLEQSTQFLPPPDNHAHYLNQGGYSAQMKAYYESRTTPAGIDMRLHVMRKFQKTALKAKPVDTFYLILLQLVCVNNTSTEDAIPMPWRSIHGVVGSLSLMSKIIAGLYGFTEDFCLYFKTVPRPIHEISLMSPTVNHFVGRALAGFPERYNQAYNIVLTRGYPLLPDELWYDLNICSPIVQKLFNDHFLVVCFRFNDTAMMGTMQTFFQQIQDSFYSQRLRVQQPSLANSVRPMYEEQTRPLCQRSLQLFQAYSAQTSNMPVQHGLGLQGLPPGMSPVQRTQSHSRRPRSNGSQSQILPSNAGYVSSAGFRSSLPLVPSASGVPAINTMRPISGFQFMPPTFSLHSMALPSQQIPPQYQQQQQQEQQRATEDPASLPFWNRGDGVVQSAVSNPGVYALHQLHLLDKHMKVDKTSPHPGPFFQVVASAPLPLQSFSTQTCQHVFKFELKETDMSQMPVDHQPFPTQPAQYLVKSASQFLRFRCVKPESGDTDAVKHPLDWQTYWPKNIIFTCNGKALEPRKKVQWHKDLPIDLTPHLKIGENVIKVLINRLKNQSIEHYAVTVERSKLAPAEDITNYIQTRIRPGAEFVKSLFQKASDTSDDDDMVVVTATRNVSIVDPILNGGICKLPVRSRNCLHPQAFELESFLQSRLKPADSDVHNLDWSCPICKMYAGPDVLHVEEYFLKVRAVLEKRAEQEGDDSMETRSIIISTDGAWIPKMEELEGEAGDGESLKRKRATSKPRRRSEVIELD